MRQPTELQAATWALVLSLGSQSAAARSQGTSQGTIRGRLRSYAEATGHTGPLPGMTSSIGRPIGITKAMVTAANERTEAAVRAVAEMQVALGRIEAKVDRVLVLARRPAVAAPVLSTRRLADGGKSRREQLREAR